MDKRKRTNDKQRFTNTTHKAKDWVTQTSLNTGGAPEGLAVPAPLVDPVV
jgi:hypothetical protein